MRPQFDSWVRKILWRGIGYPLQYSWASLVAQPVKNLPAMWRLGLDPWVGIPFSVVPFSSCLQSFPASRSFPMSQFFASGGQSIGVSATASVLPMNIQDSFPFAGGRGWPERAAGHVPGYPQSDPPDRKSTRLNSSHTLASRMPSSA